MKPIEALARAMYHEQLNQLAGDKTWPDLPHDARKKWLAKAQAVEGMLWRGGFAVVLDEAALLRKDTGIKLTDDFPIYGQSVPATMESTLDPSNPNRRQLWPIDGGKKD